jgi:hypothetical protein
MGAENRLTANGSDEEWSDSGHILKMEPTGIPNELNMQGDRKRGDAAFLQLGGETVTEGTI